MRLSASCSIMASALLCSVHLTNRRVAFNRWSYWKRKARYNGSTSKKIWINWFEANYPIIKLRNRTKLESLLPLELRHLIWRAKPGSNPDSVKLTQVASDVTLHCVPSRKLTVMGSANSVLRRVQWKFDFLFFFILNQPFNQSKTNKNISWSEVYLLTVPHS